MEPDKRDALEKRAVNDAEALMEGLQSNLTKSLDCLPLLASQESVVTQSFTGLFRGLYGLSGPPATITPETDNTPTQSEKEHRPPPPMGFSQN